MNKKKRFLKIFDNFTKVELYFLEKPHSKQKTIPTTVIVDARTFSGTYEITISMKNLISFQKDIELFMKNIERNKENKTLSFNAEYDTILLEIKEISSTKIEWDITLKPFLNNIEILLLKIETELNLLNSIKKINL